MGHKTVLLIDDNERLNEGNRRALTLAGYDVLAATKLGAARELLAEHNAQVILMDITLPDGCGIDFCGEIREYNDAHILFLTSRVEREDRLRGLRVGDDYITKPYDIEEMIARVASAMRRREIAENQPKTLALGNLVLDIIAGQALVNGKDLLLSAKEFALLLLLARNENKELCKQFIYEWIWKTPMVNDSRALRSHICNLREKMAYAGCDYTVNAVYGKGYCFEKY